MQVHSSTDYKYYNLTNISYADIQDKGGWIMSSTVTNHMQSQGDGINADYDQHNAHLITIQVHFMS